MVVTATNTTVHYNRKDHAMTHNSTQISEIILPLAPIQVSTLEAQICQKFVKHLRHVPSSRMSVKILSSIQYAADILGCSDAHVSKVLVDYGLRAPRGSFPETFLEHVDASFMRAPHEIGAASWSYRQLHDHWTAMGEDSFAGMRRHYPVYAYSFVTN